MVIWNSGSQIQTNALAVSRTFLSMRVITVAVYLGNVVGSPSLGVFQSGMDFSLERGFFFQQQVRVVMHKLAVKLTGFRREVRLNDYSGLFWRPYKSSIYENSNLSGQGECFLACVTFCSLVFPQKEENL